MFNASSLVSHATELTLTQLELVAVLVGLGVLFLLLTTLAAVVSCNPFNLYYNDCFSGGLLLWVFP